MADGATPDSRLRCGACARGERHRDGAEPAPKGFAGAFELQGTDGYKLLGLIGSNGTSGVLTLFVGKKGQEADYLAWGEVGEESVHFDLGRLGVIDLTVQPTERMETARPLCGKSVTVEGAEYVGTLDFHGEEGFTRRRSDPHAAAAEAAARHRLWSECRGR